MLLRLKKECFLRMIFCASTFECHTSKVEKIKTLKEEGSTTLTDIFSKYSSIKHGTMLQELSKYEVKALLKFEHFTAPPPLLREIQFWQIRSVQKCHFWQFWRLLTLNFGKFCT